MPLCRQGFGEMAANEPCASCYGNFHGLFLERLRSIISDGQTLLMNSLRQRARCSALALYIIEFPCRLSLTNPAALSMLRCLEMEGKEILNIAVISPAAKSLRLSA